jgi:hypothetical protein
VGAPHWITVREARQPALDRQCIYGWDGSSRNMSRIETEEKRMIVKQKRIITRIITIIIINLGMFPPLRHGILAPRMS